MFEKWGLTRAQIAGGHVTLEPPDQQAKSLSARAFEIRVAAEHQLGVVARCGQQIGMDREVRELKGREAALTRTKHLAGSAQAKILFRDQEPVLGASHHIKP